jgi:hypothetical protein
MWKPGGSQEDRRALSKADLVAMKRGVVAILGAASAIAAATILPVLGAPGTISGVAYTTVKLADADEGTEPRIAFDGADRGWTVTNSGGTAVVYTSGNHGHSWERTEGVPADQLQPSIDVDIVTTSTGRIIATELDFGGINFRTSYSDDGGKTWTVSQGTQDADMDRQWLAAGPDDPTTHQPTVFLLYHNLFSGAATHNMWVMRSNDNGATFGTPVPVTLPGSEAWLDLQCADSGGPSSLVVNQQTGRIYVFWGTRSSPAGGCAAQPFEVNVVAATKVWSATSPDDSLGSWVQSPVVDDTAAGNIVGMQLSPGTLDRAGNVWVTYPESPNPYPDYDGAAIRVRWAPPDLSRWSAPITIAPAGGYGNVLAHIIAGDPGKIAVAYYAGLQAPKASPAWYLRVARSDDALAASPHVSTDAVSHIPAYTGTASELMGACGSGAAAGIENGLACGRSTDVWGIALDRQCNVYVAWPTVKNDAPGTSAGTFVSSQVAGPGLCASGTSAPTQRRVTKVLSKHQTRSRGALAATGVADGTGVKALGFILLVSALAIGSRFFGETRRRSSLRSQTKRRR